jgi:leucyl-tRNA synthetase
MELTNEVRRVLDEDRPAGEAVRALVLMLAPMAPFIAEELWREVLGGEGSVHRQAWPPFDPALVTEDTVKLIVQIDGKVRDTVEVDPGISPEEAEALARASQKVQRALDGRQIVRVVARPPRLVNLVTRG